MKNLYLFLLFSFCSMYLSAQIESLPPFGWEAFDMPPSSINEYAETDGRLWAINGNIYYSDDEGLTWERHPSFLFDNISSIVSLDFGALVSRQRTFDAAGYSSTRYIKSWRFIDGGNNFSSFANFNISTYHFGYYTSTGLIKKSENEVIEIGGQILNRYVDLQSYTPSEGWQNYSLEEREYNSILSRRHLQDTLVLSFIDDNDSLGLAFFTDDYENPETVPFLSDISEYNANRVYNNGKIIKSIEGVLTYTSNFGESWETIDYNNLIDTTGISIQDIDFGEYCISIRRDNKLWRVDYDDLDSYELICDVDFSFENYEITENYILLNSLHGTYLRRQDEEDFHYRTIGLEGNISNLLVADSTIYANSRGGFKMNGESTNWNFNEEFNPETVDFLTSVNGVFYRAEFDTLYRSVDQGVNWEFFASIGDNLNKISTNEAGAFFYSDNVLFFTEDGINFSAGSRPGDSEIYGDENKLVSFDGMTRHISIDMGQTWETTVLDSLMPGNIIYTAGGLTSIQLASGNPYENIPGEVFRSEDDGMSWEKVNEIEILKSYPFTSDSFKYVKGKYFAHNQDLIFLAMNSKVVVSNDGGYTYYYLSSLPFSSRFVKGNNTGIPFTYTSLSIPEGFVIDNDMLLAYTTNQGLFRTSLSLIKEIIENPENLVNEVIGKAFVDTNSNCLFDEGELALPNGLVSFDDFSTLTNDEGDYSIVLPIQEEEYNYDVQGLTDYYLTCLPSSQLFQVIYDNEASTLNFAFQPKAVVILDTLQQDVCYGDEWLGNVITEDIVWFDTMELETQLLVTVYEAFVLDDSESEFFFSGASPQLIAGTLVLTDTSFTINYGNYLGCDSTVTFIIDILSNTQDIENQIFETGLSPNPTKGKSILHINSTESKTINIDVLTIQGELILQPLRNEKLTIGENDFNLDMTNLSAGVYYLRIRIQSGEIQYLKFIKV